MSTLSTSPDDYASHADYAQAMATLAAQDEGRDEWGLGGDSDYRNTGTIVYADRETEYAVEAAPGACARNHDNEIAGVIDELVDYRNGARLIKRDVFYGPWRYVTPEEIEAAQ